MNAQVKPQAPVRVLEDVVIEQFNETNVSLLAKEIEKQLLVIGEKFGVTLSSTVGKTTFNSLAIRVNGYITTEVEAGVKPQWKANYMQFCHLLGLTADDFGRFVYNLNLKHPEKEKYEIVGMTPKSLDLIIRTATDKFYRLPLEESRFVEDYQPAAVAETPVEVPEVEAVVEVPEVEAVVEDSVINDVIEEVLKPQSKVIDLSDIQELDFDTDSLDDLDLALDPAELD